MKKKQNKMNKQTMKKVFAYIGKYKFYLLFSVLLAGVSVALTLYVPIQIGYAIDGIISAGNVDFSAIRMHLVTVAVMIALIGIMQWIMNVLNNQITYNVIRDMRSRAFEKLQVLPFSYLDSHPQGDVVSRIISDVDQFADGLLMGFSQLFTGIVTIIGTLCFMLSINVWITLVVVLVTPLSFFIARFIAKKTYSMFQKMSEARGAQTGFIDEMISNQKVVSAYSRNEANAKEFEQLNDELAKYSLQATFFSSITNPATRFVNSIVYACVALFGAIMAVKGNITVGMLSCFLSYANQYTKPFNDISSVVTEFQNALACAGRIIDFIEEEPVPADSENAVEPEHIEGKVELDDISFSYLPEQNLISHLSVSVKPGMRVAIVGPTGCGKTTLINLLMRFYELNGGQILFDGIPGTDIKRSALRKNFGMVLQDTWLKSTSILENIRMANPSATYDEVVEAAKKAYAHSFIKRLPDGYYTVIGEDGGSLSQGQKQLLCIARIMLCNPSMLILDEATSSIDTATEIRIQKAFASLMKGRTSFIVAHRLSTIVGSDLILVMKDGTIIEQGTHAQLLEKQGFYYTLYNSQFPEKDAVKR